jgi:hypothetical protein
LRVDPPPQADPRRFTHSPELPVVLSVLLQARDASLEVLVRAGEEGVDVVSQYMSSR